MSKGESLSPADVQYNVDYGSHFGPWRSFAMQKRWPKGNLVAIIFVHLEACGSAEELMSISFENLIGRRWRDYLNI